MSLKTTYHYKFYNSDDTFDIQTQSWKSPQDIQDDILQLLTSIHLDISHIDLFEDHCMCHNSNNISHTFHDHCNSYKREINWIFLVHFMTASASVLTRQRTSLDIHHFAIVVP